MTYSYKVTTRVCTEFLMRMVLSCPASEMTYIVSSGALNSTPTNQPIMPIAYAFLITR